MADDLNHTLAGTPADHRPLALQLKPGDWVRHAKFGLGYVKEAECDPLPPQDWKAQVAFEAVGLRWLALQVAKLALVQVTDPSQPGFEAPLKASVIEAEKAAQARTKVAVNQPKDRWMVQRSYVVKSLDATLGAPQYEVQTIAMSVIPADLETTEPRSMLQIEAMASRAWKMTGQRPDKRHRYQYMLERGQRITPFVTPVPLPWTSQPVLSLPRPGTPNTPGYRGRFNAGSSRGRQTLHAPHIVVGVEPPYKRLRGVLHDAVQGLACVSEIVRYDIKAHTVFLPETNAHFFELLGVDFSAELRPGTLEFLGVMRRRVVNAIQALRSTAPANGRWWPAPERFQLIFKSDGRLAARMQFTPSYQPEKRAWIEWEQAK